MWTVKLNELGNPYIIEDHGISHTMEIIKDIAQHALKVKCTMAFAITWAYQKQM
jgi:hypothetical protein